MFESYTRSFSINENKMTTLPTSKPASDDAWVSISPREVLPHRGPRNSAFGAAAAFHKYTACQILEDAQKKWNALIDQKDDPSRQAKVAFQISNLQQLKTCLATYAPTTVNLAQKLPSFQEFIRAAELEQLDDPQDTVKLMKIDIALFTSLHAYCLERNLDHQAKAVTAHIGEL